jgi:hypothetical protein
VLGKSATWSRAVAAADVVVAGNDYLAERASRTARQVVAIPSCVEPADYPVKSSYVLCDPPRLVWVGSPSTEPFLRIIALSLLEVHRRTGARLTVVSAGSAPLGPLDAIVDRLPWALDSVASALSASDVAIGPLTDSPYARGKCAYKLLQYAAGRAADGRFAGRSQRGCARGLRRDGRTVRVGMDRGAGRAARGRGRRSRPAGDPGAARCR